MVPNTTRPGVVCATGPESTGKTTLCRLLAAHFGVPWLPEYAREHFSKVDAGTADRGAASYDRQTVETIAREQWRRERDLIENAVGPVVLDTDLAVIFVWWQEKYGEVPTWIDQAWAQQTPRLYLLCRPDLGWQPDPLRESPHDLERLLKIYRNLLIKRGLSFAEVGGVGDARGASAIAAATPVLSRAAVPQGGWSLPVP